MAKFNLLHIILIINSMIMVLSAGDDVSEGKTCVHNVNVGKIESPSSLSECRSQAIMRGCRGRIQYSPGYSHTNWGCYCCSDPFEADGDNTNWNLYDNPTTPQHSGKSCVHDSNIGKIQSPSSLAECTANAISLGCRGLVQYSPGYSHTNWGCYCCTDPLEIDTSNENWNLYDYPTTSDDGNTCVHDPNVNKIISPNSLSQCITEAIAGGCQGKVQYSPGYSHTNWGCYCCLNPFEQDVDNTNWNIYDYPRTTTVAVANANVGLYRNPINNNYYYDDGSNDILSSWTPYLLTIFISVIVNLLIIIGAIAIYKLCITPSKHKYDKIDNNDNNNKENINFIA